MKVFQYKKFWLFMLFWFCGVTFFFIKYAYEIDQFNVATRVFLTTGKKSARNFNDKCIPVSYSAREKKSFISPFYVVHYGLIHSSILTDNYASNGFHWWADPSLKYWNITPANLNASCFINSANWVVKNIEYVNGNAHLLYNFDWKYANYPGGKLLAPWWSGLTDAYALILLLRAYDHTGNPEYVAVANKLYKSVLVPVKKGGSLVYLDGYPWIEEYVSQNANEENMSKVLNGMIYATFGIKAYEEYFQIKNKYNNKLFNSLAVNIAHFDNGRWSYYDAINSPSNMKYHRIHVSLLSSLFDLTGNNVFKLYANKWTKSVNNIGYYWLSSAAYTVGYIHFITLYFFVVFIFLFLFLLKIYTQRLRHEYFL